MSVFCDGACPGNGTARAAAAWAWAYWDCQVNAVRGEPKVWGARSLEGTATNQRAELKALLEAVRFCAIRPGCTIYSDSMYAINCASVWGPGWKRKGWKRSAGDIMNLDLIQPLVEEWALSKVPLKHVRGHQSVGPEAHGNNWVDRAAVAAVAAQSIGVPLNHVTTSNGTPVKSILKKTIDIDTWSVEKAEQGPDLEFITHTPIRACPRVDSFRPNDIRRWFS
jgi:ribonuclease HI